MIYRNDMAMAKKTGGRGGETFFVILAGAGLENFCKIFPPPSNRTPIPLSSKTFGFIESLFMLLGKWREVVFVNEESAVLKILGAF